MNVKTCDIVKFQVNFVLWGPRVKNWSRRLLQGNRDCRLPFFDQVVPDRSWRELICYLPYVTNQINPIVLLISASLLMNLVIGIDSIRDRAKMFAMLLYRLMGDDFRWRNWRERQEEGFRCCCITTTVLSIIIIISSWFIFTSKNHLTIA